MAKNKKQADPGVEEKNITPGENESGGSEESIINLVWNFLSSMKLGIILLLVMALVSIIGTIWIPRDPVTGQQDFTVFYNNIVFRLLMGLLALNLLVCSLNRLRVVRNTLKGPNADVSENFVKNLKGGDTIKLKEATGQAAGMVKGLLKKRGYRIFEKQDGDVAKIAADRGHIGILGPYVTHLSFIVLIVAVVIKFSGYVGFEGQLVGIPGETYNLSQVQGIQNVEFDDYFDIKIRDFRTEYRPDGRTVKQWYSDVTVIDGNETYDYTIYVNNPLVHNGIKFYQMSYGTQFSGKQSGPTVKDQPFQVGVEGYIQPPGATNIIFIPMGFNDNTKKVVLRTYKDRQMVNEQEVALNTPVKYEQTEVTFTSAGGYTVLSVKRDPGVPVVGVGSILLILGVIFSFILRQRRIWAVISPEKDGSVVYIGGISAKDKRGVDNDLEEIADGLKN